MGLARGLVFVGVAILPSLVLGLIFYIALGGTTSDSMEGGEFMYGPCYGIPALCLIFAFIYGIKDDQRE
ncbi:MAG: hypothetical protein CMB08_03530 [Euryarchaeota archaeon]|nr:hypothetical protein [Euryarchaeota archaeon]|tara:strand:- start:3331 stop:3537 length:207 start_codon:yes stop_codon:yes gene_type:complete